jgi:hypothetical protein
MKFNETTVLTVPGLCEFSGIVSTALKEYARLQSSALFNPQFSLVDDTAEIGGIQETKHHLCVGRKLGHIPTMPAASVWGGIIADENVRFGVTIDDADAVYIENLKKKLNDSTSPMLETKLPSTSVPTRGCIFLSSEYCDKVFSSSTTTAEKVRILSVFMLTVDTLLQ